MLVQVVWEPYADHGDADQPWVVSGRPLFGRDIWVHCLNEIEPLRLRLAARTLGLHQGWCEETEPRRIGRKTRGKAKMVDWRARFPEQYVDWQHGGQLVELDAPDSIAYLRRFQEEYDHRDFMRPQRLASLEVQLIEARAALETLVPLPAGVPQLRRWRPFSSSYPECAERDLLTRSEELRDALARETDTAAELTQLRSQLTQRGFELPREVSELQGLLSLERRDLERQQTRWEQERSRWELERRELAQQCVEARTSQGVAERLLKASEERYQRGRECAREQGR
ncbi:hypothetical protein Taro_037302, partial [Colocasia esculenta]|nr:hypothetical protein [Colocasia esculenta]